MTITGNRNSNVDNLQGSVESWITNIDSLEIYSLDRVLSCVLVFFFLILIFLVFFLFK